MELDEGLAPEEFKNKTKEQLIEMLINLQKRQKTEGYIETESQQSERVVQLQALIDQIKIPFISTDLDGFIKGWNPGVEKMTGYSSSDAPGEHISFVFPEDEHEFLLHKVVAPLKEKGNHEIDVRMRKKSGEDFYARLSLAIQKDGAVKGMTIWAIEITHRKKAEEEPKKRVVELESMHQAFVGRELRMKELKEEIKKLKGKLMGDEESRSGKNVGF